MIKLILYFVLLFVLLISCEKFTVEENADTFFHVQINKADIPVWIKGNTASQKFIIYINGGPGLTSIDVARADMFNWSNSLESDFAMVYYDQRGCGNAQGNFTEQDININQYLLDLDGIIQVINDKYFNPEIYLMGHSFGSFIGAKYLLQQEFQNKIQGWISIDGAYNFDYDLTWSYRREFLRSVAMEQINLGQDDAHWQNALTWTDENIAIITKEQKEKWREFIGYPGGKILPDESVGLNLHQYLSIGFNSSYNTFPAYMSNNLNRVNDLLNAEVEGINLINSVHNIKIPSLFIWGKYDDLIPPQEGKEVFKNLGTLDLYKTFVELENSSHEPFISSPNEFYKAIKEFMQL